MRKMLLVAALFLAGCGQYGYRYHPEHQNTLNPVFADYKLEKDSVTIMVDTHQRRLDKIEIMSDTGIGVKPTKVDYPQFAGNLIGDPLTGSGERRYTGDVAQGPTIAYFSRKEVGDGPWRVAMDIGYVGHFEFWVGKK